LTALGRDIVRQRKGGYSMQATNDHRVLVGVGPATTVEKAVIRWPSGREITLENLKADQDYKLVEPKTDTAKKPAAAKDKPAAPTEKAKPAS
jgi:enediyne biosynthesis protein E4